MIIFLFFVYISYRMRYYNNVFLIFLISTFLLGLYVHMYWDIKYNLINRESMENNGDNSDNSDNECPNLLIQQGDVLLLHNTAKDNDDTNPIPFFNLDEYINYLEVQKEKGINCPVLYLQRENNAQGKDVYRVRPSPFNLEGGLPPDNQASTNKIKDSPDYNSNQYAGFDAHGQNVGEYTNVDAIHDSTNVKKISDNPMDSKWAGVTYTQQMVESGKYIDRELTKPSYFNPKTAFYPSIPSPFALPVDNLG